MFYLSFLNQSDTSPYSPLFEIIYCVEVFLIICYLIAFIPLSIGVYKATPLHLNIRCYLLKWILHGFIASMGRFPLLVNQIYDIRESEVSRILLTASSVSREALFAYSSILSLMVAVDRVIATYAYAWYEKQTPSTFFVFIFLCAISEAFSIVTGISVVYEFYTIYCHLVLMAAGGFIGFMCFWFVLHCNIRLHDHFRPHYFGFSEYCIARSYQIKENVLVLKVLRNIALDTVYYTIPPFVLFLFYVLTPAGTGLDVWRNLAVAVYDLFIALFALIAPLRLITSDIRFERGMRSVAAFDAIYDNWRKRTTKVESETRAATDQTVQYFAQLDKEWMSDRTITISITI